MKNNFYKNSILSFVYCFYEKWRILFKLGMEIPSDQIVIKRIKKPVRSLVKKLLNEEILFITDPDAWLLKSSLQQLNIGENRTTQKATQRVLLVSHELSRTGAPQALLMLAKVFHARSDFEVCVLALEDGPMRKEFESVGLVVLILDELPCTKKPFLSFLSYFEAVYVCSCSWQFLLALKHINKPVAWWVHEVFSKPEEIDRINQFIDFVDLILGGSPLTVNCFENNFSTDKIESLLYGLEDIECPKPREERKLLTFALLGTICPRKGTDIFVAAIKQLPPYLRVQARFVIVGDKEPVEANTFHASIVQAAFEIDELELHEAMPINSLIDAYSDFDVIVSASRIDPMPIVLTYGFMFSKLCLCSDAVGTAQLISDGKNGLLFESESVDSLEAKMAAILEHRIDSATLAAAGRNVYDQYFSKPSFERDALALHKRLIATMN